MKSILSKLGLAVTSLVIFVFLMVWVFQIVFLNRFYVNERTNNLINEAKSLSQIIIETEDDRNLIDEVEKLSSAFNAKIDIIDASGDIKLSRGDIPRMGRAMEESIRQKEIGYILNGETIVLQDTHHRFSTAFLIVGVPVDTGDKISGGVIFSTSLAPVQETTSILKKQLSIIAIVSIIIATLLAFLLAKVFTRPILKITEAANEIVKGNYDIGVNIKSKDEIGMLGATVYVN